MADSSAREQAAQQSIQKAPPLHQDVRKQQKRDIATLIACIRILSAIVISTYFQPDEYYQSLEPAWQLAYGKDSGAWITWEWDHQLRSSLHPLCLVPVYLAASVLNWILALPVGLRATSLIWAPRLLHAGFSTLTDYATWQLAEQIFGEQSHESAVALAFNLLSPFHFFAGARSFSNVVEASLTAQALACWPWPWFGGKADAKRREQSSSRLARCVICAALAVVTRPTNGLIWLVLTGSLVFYASQDELMQLSQAISICGTATLAASYGADRLFYGEWTFPPAKFLGFNVVQNLSEFYGSNRRDYYLTEGLPLLLMTALPFALVGFYQARNGGPGQGQVGPEPADATDSTKATSVKSQSDKSRINYGALRALATVGLVMVTALSMIAHKEVRFLYPLFPMFAILAAQPVCQFFNFTSFPRPASNAKLLTGLAIILVNIVIAVYISFFHQRGPLAVMSYLRSQFIAVNADALILGTSNAGPTSLFTATGATIIKLFGGTTAPQSGALRSISAGFLMPCHSTPWRSHLVNPEIHAWALTCEPPIGLEGADRDRYLDEADLFYADPASWLRENMGSVPTIDEPWVDEGWDMRNATIKRPVGPTINAFEGKGKRPWPRYVAFFEQLLPVVNDVAGGAKSRYEECWRGFNTHWHDDWRRQGDIVVWCVDGSVNATKIVAEFDDERGRRGPGEWEL